MITFLKAVNAEWKIQCRQRSNWLLALAFLMIFWLSFTIRYLPITSAISFSVKTATGLGMFGCLFIAVISVRSILFETHAGFDFFWSRPLPSRTFFWLKFIATSLTVFTFLIPTILCYFVLLLIHFGVEALLPGLGLWMLFLCPTYLFILGFCILACLVIRHNVIATVFLAIVISLVLFQSYDATRLLGFAPYSIYTSSIIGFGPDKELVILNRVFYLTLLFSICLLVSIFSPHLLPAIPIRKRIPYYLFSICLAAALIAFSGWIASRFFPLSKIANLPANPGDHLVQKKACVLFDAYTVALEIDENGKITSGKATLEIQLVEAQTTIPITLNRGLEMTDPALKANDGLFLNPDKQYTKNEIKIIIPYQGEVIVPRFAYSNLMQEDDVAALGFEPGFYADPNYTFVLRQGTWHPFSECTPDSITITIPNTYPNFYSSADSVKIGPLSSTFTWSESIPAVLLVSGSNPTVITEKDWRVDLPEHELAEIIQSFYLETYRSAINHWSVNTRKSGIVPKRIIVVPFLDQTIQQDDPAVFFVTMNSYKLRQIVDGKSIQETVLGTNPFIMSVAADVVIAWWCEGRYCPEILTAYERLHTQTEIHQEDALVVSLLYYASLQLSNEMDGNVNVDKILSLYQPVLDPMKMIWPPKILPPESAVILLKLNALWKQTKPEEFWQLLEECREQSQSGSLQMEEFASLVQSITGQDFEKLPETNP